MNDKKKICSGFPEKPGGCTGIATHLVVGARQHVCESHAKQAAAKGLHVHNAEKKS